METEIKCQKDLLFLGAGFSAAVGGLLAREFWAGITNHPEFINNIGFKDKREKSSKGYL